MGTRRGARSALGTNVMDRRTVAGSVHRRELTRLRLYLGRGCALMTAGLLLLMTVSDSSAAPVHAASSAALADTAFTSRLAAVPGIRASEQYVFTIGIVDRVSADALTLRFEDGATETYTLNGATTIQTQNGDALGLADLEIGDMVIVLTVENSSTAVTIVNGGENGFHAAGPGDIRGHDECECASCGAHSP